MFILSSLRSIVESKKVSDKHRISKLWVLTKASIKGTLIKSWAARPFKFQWQNLIGEDFLGPGFVSVSPEFTKIIFEKRLSKNKWNRTYAQTAKHDLADFTVTKKPFKKIGSRYTKKQHGSKCKEVANNVEVIGHLLCDLTNLSFMNGLLKL